MLIVSIRSILHNYAAKFFRFGIFPCQISDSTDGTAKSLVLCKAYLVI